MRVTFVAMGCENISLEYLSASLKQEGHEVNLAYDPALFDDKNYFYKPFLAKVFDQRERVVRQVIAQNPDLVGISVFASNYQWALDISRRIKAIKNIPIIFGGIHPITVPGAVLENDCVDYVCRGEGEKPLLELLQAMEKNQSARSILNLWSKNDGKIIENPIRPLCDLDTLPMPDKCLFENDIPIRYMYLTVTTKGCPFACAFCSNSYLKEFEKGKGRFFRQRSVEKVMEELIHYKQRYDYQWVDIKNNTFPADKKWTLEFLERYTRQIAVPLRVMGHPKKIDDEIAAAMKKAGVWRVQLGVESLDEDLRRDLLERHETNEQILNAMSVMDRHGIGYSVDYMVGLPGQKTEELEEAAKTLSGFKNAVRITPFWIQYLYGTRLFEFAKMTGAIDSAGENAAINGLDHHYIYQGSVKGAEKIRTLRSFHVLFRLAPTIGPKWTAWLIFRKRYKIFRYLPMGPVINLVDFFASFVIRDLTSIAYIKTYGQLLIQRIFPRGGARRFFGPGHIHK